ncbi:MAG: hypothetical protein G01um101417_163 [Parcubacteria group bacterium Gr01-1014_17]|nr:MAG: hypothetical protein G01um101417_163 [Parcubacteria group bacterium Gr01-1014_17]
MFNLLTEQAKKNVAVEYRFRLAIVACAFVFAEILLALLGGAFSFLAIRGEGKRIAGEAAALAGARDARAGAAQLSSVTEIQARLEMLATNVPAHVSGALAALVALRPQSIRIVALTAFPAGEGNWSLSASGIAATRDALASFERALNGDRRFAEVELPLGSFAKDKELPFTVTAAYRDTQL